LSLIDTRYECPRCSGYTSWVGRRMRRDPWRAHLACKCPSDSELDVKPVLVTPQLPDARYWQLHQKCAAGTIAPDELAELDLMCAEKERACSEDRAA
jgi:hypothetical protein